jgi:hypothetical protein
MQLFLSKLFSWDFIRMGKGIESRYARCSSWWRPHLSCTRNFIAQHAQPGGRLAILGAGRLLDVDLKALIPLYSEIHLFDADPTVIRTWRKTSGIAFRKSVIPRIQDVTGTLAEWTRGLAKAAREGELASYLASLETAPGPWESDRFDGVISLNITGQLPIYWRDRVSAVKPVLSQAEHEALITSMSTLQSAHLQALQHAPLKWSLAITDTEYYTYHVDRSDWHVEPALHGDALATLNSESPALTTRSKSCWLWHLVPQFVESDDEGHIHRVEARAWQRVLTTTL